MGSRVRTNSWEQRRNETIKDTDDEYECESPRKSLGGFIVFHAGSCLSYMRASVVCLGVEVAGQDYQIRWDHIYDLCNLWPGIIC